MNRNKRRQLKKDVKNFMIKTNEETKSFLQQSFNGEVGDMLLIINQFCKRRSVGFKKTIDALNKISKHPFDLEPNVGLIIGIIERLMMNGLDFDEAVAELIRIYQEDLKIKHHGRRTNK